MSGEAVEAGTLPTSGSVKWYNADKGYGFIAVAGAKDDVFFHVKELRKSSIIGVNDGMRLGFICSKGPNGLFATNIKVLEAS